MASLNVANTPKDQLVWLSRHTCKAHRVSYLNHYNCFLAEKGIQERVGFFDIESSNLKADYGILLTYAIKELDKDEYLQTTITAKDLRGDGDKRIVLACVNHLKDFDRIVTFYGKFFDMPFLRTRAIAHGIEFPEYGQIKHDDLWFLVRAKFKLSSNRLENASRVLLGKTSKTRLDGPLWIKAMMGDPKALDYIAEHNRFDVLDLESLYKKVVGYTRRQNVSI